MKEKIKFKTWISVFWGGIWQFVSNIFSWKNKTPFWRVIWLSITVCIVTFTLLLCFSFYREYCRKESYREYYDTKLSDNYKFRDGGYNDGNSYIYDSRTRKKIIKGIDWIALPQNGDSLFIVAKNGKRGFVNRYTGQIAIPFNYDAAWSFSDESAAVCEGDSIYFIDHSGKPINDKKFLRKQGYDNYAFHGNYAAIPYEEKIGLMDRMGNWVLPPEYDNITIGNRNMWYVVNNEKVGVIDTNGQFVFPIEYEYIKIHQNNGITVTKENHSQSRYDYDGTLIDEFVFDEVYEMAYFINEFDDEGNQKRAVDDIMKYSAGNFYGLMTRTGKPITPPLYSWIESVAPGVYQCQIPDTFEYIMIDDKGEKING